MALPTAGVISGRVVDEYGEPVGDAIVSAMRRQFINGERRLVPAGSSATTNDIGEFRLHSLAPGEYFISTTQRNILAGNTDRTGYGPTFYPSSSSVDTAQAVSVHAAETLSNIVVTLSPSRLNRISGYVLGADGHPVRAGSVMAIPRSGIQFINSNGMIRPDGSFEVSGIADGDYTLRAMIGPLIMGAGGPGQAPPLQATAAVTVAGGDLSNVVLRPMQPVVISGRVTGDAATMAAIRPGTIQLAAARLSPMDVVGPSGPPARLRDDFTFELTVYPGRVSLRGLGLNGALIDSVRWNGIDVTRGFNLTDADNGGNFEISLTNQTAKLSVTVADANGQAVSDCDVVIFPADENWWGVSMPGHNSNGRTNQEGRFESAALLPGTYYVVAINGLETFEAGDPAFMAAARNRAQRITLAAGETANVQTRAQEP
jgi:protocatechuate 3,4-dioxygenase beta subunit